MLLWKFLQKQQHGLLQVHIKKIAGMFDNVNIDKFLDDNWQNNPLCGESNSERKKNLPDSTP